MTHDGDIGTASTIGKHNKEPDLKAPRRRSLGTGVTFGNVNDRNHSAGGINTIITSHGGRPGGDRVHGNASHPAGARTNKRARSGRRARQVRLRATRIGVRRHINRHRCCRRLRGSRRERAIAGHIYAVAAPVGVKHRRPVPPRMRRLDLGIVQPAKPHSRHAIYNGGGLPVETACARARRRRDNSRGRDHGSESRAT